MNNIHKLMVLMCLLPISGAAEVNITDQIEFNLYNGAYIVINPQEVDYLTLYNDSDTPASSLEIGINGTQIIFKAFINKTVSNISYLNDNMTWNDSGALGLVNISAKMGEAITNYSMSIDSITSQENISDSQGWTVFTYSQENEHLYRIFKSGAIYIPPVGNKTIITFTDTACLNIGSFCTSEIVIFNGSTKIGAIGSKEEYTEISRTTNLLITLDPGSTAILNNNDLFYETFMNNILSWFSILLISGIIIILIIIITINRK